MARKVLKPPNLRVIDNIMFNSRQNLNFMHKPRVNIDRINYDFISLETLAKKIAPQVLPKINFLHNVVLAHAHGRLSDYNALKKIADVVRHEGLDPHIINSAKMHLDGIHGKAQQFDFPFMHPMSNLSKSAMPKARGIFIKPLMLRKHKRAKINFSSQFPLKPLKHRKHR